MFVLDLLSNIQERLFMKSNKMCSLNFELTMLNDMTNMRIVLLLAFGWIFR